MPPTSRQQSGRLGEDAAVRWYLAHGFGLVAQNWRCRAGELDVIVRRGGLVVFCEVKSRAGPRFGEPEEAVTRSQQRRIRAAAAAFLHVMRADPGWAKTARVRFDVVCVRPGPSGLSVSVVEEAF